MSRPEAAASRGAWPRAVDLVDEVAPAALSLLLFGQALAGGANGDLSSAVAAVAELAFALFVFAVVRTGATFWRRAAGPVALFLAALAWASRPPGFFDPVQLVAPDALPLEVVKLTGVGALALAAAAVGADQRRFRSSLGWLVAGGLIFITLSTLLRVGSAQIDGGRWVGPIGNVNGSGCLFAVLSMLGGSVVRLRLRELDLRAPGVPALLATAAAALLSFVALVACAATGSRTALSLAASGMVVLALDASRGSRSRTGRWAPTAAAVFVLAAGLLAFAPSMSRIAWIAHDADGRLQVLWHFWPMVRDHPLTGAGLGSFVQWHRERLPPSLSAMIWDFGALHDAPLQAALEGGWPFLAVSAGASAWVFVIAARPLIGRPGSSPMVLGLLTSVLIILCGSLWDIALNIPALCAFAVALLGLAAGRAVAPSRRPRRLGGWTAFAGSRRSAAAAPSRRPDPAQPL